MTQAALNAPERVIAKKAVGHRSNGARLISFIFLLMVSGTICWSGWAIVGWMKDVNRLPLSKLVVTGERHYTTFDDMRQVILASGPLGTFMTQDVNTILQQVERLPWIKKISVRKQWPDELKIHLVEYAPVAHWNELYLIDAQGQPFSVPSERIGDRKMPLLYGPEGSEKEVLAGYMAMNAQLAASKFTLKMVTMSARHSWQLMLDNGVRLELGRDDRTRRLQRFIELYPIIPQQAGQRISYVDLRYDAGVAVGWLPVSMGTPSSDRQQNQVQAKQ